MKSHLERPWPAILEASTTLFGWTLVILVVNFVMFLLAYWIGHGRITGWDQTMQALAWLPIRWVGSPALILAYLMSGVTWYLPLHFELPRARFWMLGVNAYLWFHAVDCVVDNARDTKLFSF